MDQPSLPPEIYSHILSFLPREFRLVNKKANQLWLFSRANIFREWKERMLLYQTLENVIDTKVIPNTSGRILLQKRWTGTSRKMHIFYVVDLHMGIGWCVVGELEKAINDLKIQCKSVRM